MRFTRRLGAATLVLALGAATLVLALAAGAAVSARQLGGRPADDWSARLERPERIAGLKIDYIIASLGLKPGQTVADIGAGPGVLSIPLAKAVAPGGKVYAVEIDKDFFPHIKQKAAAENVTNVVTVLGAFTDPKLPARDVDVALFHDVLHHIEDRAGYLKATAQYVKPNGRVAIVELPPSGSHKDEPSLIVTKDQAKGWMADAGFTPVQEFDGLSEGKWFIVYARK
jgi:cyclopropane fatty-acyl-phospholipid synthase-like methyltransferase